MKNALKIFALLLSSIYCSAQEGVIMPINTSLYKIQSGTYRKDLANELDPYIGIWQGNWQGKQFTVQFEKILKQKYTFEDGSYNYEDILIGRYRITNLSDGTIIEDNFNQQNIDLVKIRNEATAKDNRMFFIYLDKDLCSNSGQIILEGNPATNQLTYNFLQDDYWKSEGCPYANQSDIPIPIPTVQIILTRL